MNYIGDTASVAQLVGVNGNGIVQSLQRMAESAATLPSDVDDLTLVVASGRHVQQDLAGSDNPTVQILLPKLEEELAKAEGKMSQGWNTRALAATAMQKDVLTSKDRVRLLLGMVDSAFNREALQDLRTVVGNICEALRLDHKGVPEPPSESLVQKLERLAQQQDRRRAIVQRVERTNHGSAAWTLASGSASRPAPENARNERGSLSGDFDLKNNQKIRVTMKSHEALYFHILTADADAESSLKVVFPQTALKNNALRPNSERKFPDMISFRDDINMWVLTKTLPRRQTQKNSAYFIFTKQRLSTGDALLTTTQMEDLLSSEVIVEVLNFLVL